MSIELFKQTNKTTIKLKTIHVFIDSVCMDNFKGNHRYTTIIDKQESHVELRLMDPNSNPNHKFRCEYDSKTKVLRFSVKPEIANIYIDDITNYTDKQTITLLMDNDHYINIIIAANSIMKNNMRQYKNIKLIGDESIGKLSIGYFIIGIDEKYKNLYRPTYVFRISQDITEWIKEAGWSSAQNLVHIKCGNKFDIEYNKNTVNITYTNIYNDIVDFNHIKIFGEHIHRILDAFEQLVINYKASKGIYSEQSGVLLHF